MTNNKVKNPKAAFCIVLAIVLFTGFIVLFSLGGTIFSEEHPKVVNYANSMCQVDSSSWKYYQCKTRTYRYVCYGPIWYVHYGENRTIPATVEGSRRYRSYSDALNKAHQYQIDSSYSCWYDTRTASVAQWDKPSTLVAIILLSCGGLTVLLTILFSFLGCRLIQQQKIQMEQNGINPDSYPNSDYYTKQ